MICEMFTLYSCQIWTLYNTFTVPEPHKFEQNKTRATGTDYEHLFFSIWVFFHDHSWTTGLQGKGEGISLTPHYHFHLLHRHLDISQVITVESSPLHIDICTDIGTGLKIRAGQWSMTAEFYVLTIKNLLFVIKVTTHFLATKVALRFVVIAGERLHT